MYIGQSVRRREDAKFLTGGGRYVDDIVLPGMAFAVFLRSTHAHALIRRLDITAAKTRPGVLAVITAEDWHRAKLGKFEMVHPMPFSDGRPANEEVRPSLTGVGERVRHVGEAIALVVAETRHQAQDGVEAIEIEFEPLPALVDTGRALDPDAPILHERFGTNLIYEVVRGDKAKTDAAFARARHITALDVNTQRVAGSPIEPRVYIGDYDRIADRYTLYATSQTPHFYRQWLAKYILFVPESKVRVVSPDVGGGFGLKAHGNPDAGVVAWAAKVTGRPVKWVSTRGEALMTDCQARDHVTRARMGFDQDGFVIALEVDTIAAFGGYLSNFGPSIPGNSYPQTITGLYKTPNLYFRVRGVYTNTVPTDAYRGSGRPEATWVNERLFENAAREMGVDVVELRRKNLIQKQEFPYKTPVGRTYDSGDPPLLLAKLEKLARYQQLRAEQRTLRARGVLMGIGVAAFLDKSGTGNSRNLASKGAKHGAYEVATVRIHSDGKATVLCGSHSHGQGHDTTFCQIAADYLGIPLEDITLVQGDTDRVTMGCGTWGSRSTTMAGSAIVQASERVIGKAKRLAAHLLECAEADVDYRDSRFTVKGTNRSVTFAEVADQAYYGGNYPAENFELGLEETVFYDGTDTNDPQAMHLVSILVDIETGRIKLRDYFTVDDAGVVINPLLVEGQVHGGLGQGIGQALMEEVTYDRTSGQLLSGSFMDYAMPRAEDFCDFKLDFISSPAPSNPLGVKGGSETGTIGAPAAIGNAVVDALWDLGVRHVPQPLTPERVWRAIADASTARR
ncbi:MAG: xanthine dehydrogenase family protein molybdopterin-binding subunit [Alphaproteobacteria bacterium]|nr:xanthine dehydrogenase family protein molybdopterin-binding subunit [Alphaproteobacteria bacterium]